MSSIFQRLHDAGIGFVVQSIKHGGFRAYLGDANEGHRAVGSCRSWAEVERWLDRHAKIHFPHALSNLSSATGED